MNDEQYLLKRWHDIRIADDTMIGGGVEITVSYPIGLGVMPTLILGRGDTRKQALVAAKAFTEERELQIAEQTDDIAWVQGCVNAMRRLLGEDLGESDRKMADEQLERGERVLAREQDRLQALKQGMREVK